MIDATSSRTKLDRRVALERIKMAGAHLNTTEAVILNLLGDKDNPNFTQIHNLIKVPNPLNSKLFNV